MKKRKNPLTFSYANLRKWIYLNISTYKANTTDMVNAAIEYFAIEQWGRKNLQNYDYSKIAYTTIRQVIDYYVNIWLFYGLSDKPKYKQQKILREKILDDPKLLFSIIKTYNRHDLREEVAILLWWLRIDPNAFEDIEEVERRIRNIQRDQ